MSDFTQIIYEQNDAAIRITLNRPEKRNALSSTLLAELRRAFALAGEDKAARVIILGGAGKDFCAGADLAQLERVSQASILENLEDAEQFAALLALMRRTPKPIVAAVQGRAFAGGAGLATACDLVIAARTAQFAYTEVRIGFVPAMVMSILRRNLPEKLAFEILTSGRIISAEQALEMGFVNRVVPDEDLELALTNLVKEYESVSASAVALTKRLLYQIDGMSFEQAVSAGVEMNAIARMTPDCQEGIRRFLSKIRE